MMNLLIILEKIPLAVKALKWVEAKGFFNPFEPIEEASRKLYEKVKGHHKTLKYVYNIIMDDETPENWRLRVGANDLKSNIPIYGQSPPSKVYELIDKEKLKRLGFSLEDKNVLSETGSKYNKYINVAVKKRDLKKHIKQILNESSKNANVQN